MGELGGGSLDLVTPEPVEPEPEPAEPLEPDPPDLEVLPADPFAAAALLAGLNLDDERLPATVPLEIAAELAALVVGFAQAFDAHGLEYGADVDLADSIEQEWVRREREARRAERLRLADFFTANKQQLEQLSPEGLTVESLAFLLRLDHDT